ncbi:MAG: hypothetical protein FK731_12930 [Asgard group archaeon]|nr:hypothetical protein [Asgard group archaeon]
MTNDDLFRRFGFNLEFDKMDLNKIAERYGTPIYLFSKRKLIENINEIKQRFKKYWPDRTLAYSLKNNPLNEILNIIAENIDHFEVSSLAEISKLQQLVRRRKEQKNIILTNIYKSEKLLSKTFESNDHSKQSLCTVYAIDSYQDFKNIEKMAKNQNEKIRVLIRVNPGIEMDDLKSPFASAHLSAKCASIINDIEEIKQLSNDSTISLWLPERKYKPKNDSAENLIIQASRSEFLNLEGIHCHLGSQITQIEYFDRFFEVISLFYKIMNERVNGKLTTLNFGGGYPVDYTSDGSVPSIESIAMSMAKYLLNANIKPKVTIESGRYITASAGILLSKINLTKESATGRNIAVLDLSVYSSLLDILVANWFYECILVNNLPKEGNEQFTTNWDLVGETNDTLDQLDPRSNIHIFTRKFPRDLEVGDLIAIKNAGAYTVCFNSHYMGRPYPKKMIIPIK